jgi:hypothetical protein
MFQRASPASTCRSCQTLGAMGTQSLVYGVIELPSRLTEAESGITSALSHLPETDEWPFLVRGMFSQSVGPQAGLDYESKVVHFGASFKEIEEDWSVWVSKFEALLGQLQGRAAVVHIESEVVGNHKLEWVGTYELGSCHWQFLRGPRSFGAGGGA